MLGIEQNGFRVGRRAEGNIFIANELIERKKCDGEKLYLCFLDIEKAYDRVNRELLCKVLEKIGLGSVTSQGHVPLVFLFVSMYIFVICVLQRLSCGVTMLLTLAAMYKVTHSVIGSAVISATVGVRQGSPTSCLLFVIFVNDLIRLIKQNCDMDGFLAWLHILIYLLMDDTVLLSTSRENMLYKIKLLNRFCASHGMEINESKTNFFVINGTDEDREAMHVDDVSVSVCEHYTYLGSPFTADGSTTTAIKLHAQNKMCHALKFVSFINKNNAVPFYV